MVWRSGTSVSLYRGVSYKDPSVQLNKQIYRKEGSSATSSAPADTIGRDPSQYGSGEDARASDIASGNKDSESTPEVEYEHEMDKLLDSLGPRYRDWPGCEPLPVDADMLPGTVPGYQPPFRILPYGVRATISQKEATALRRLARVLPPHFALGMRCRHLTWLALIVAFSLFFYFLVPRKKQAAPRFGHGHDQAMGKKFNCEDCTKTWRTAYN